MKNQIKCLVKKAMMLSLLFVVFWQIREIERNFNFFPLLKIFSFELFLAEKLDPVEMMEESFFEITAEFKEALGRVHEKLEIRFVTDNREIKVDTDIPVIFVKYQSVSLNGKKIKKFNEFHFSDALVRILAESSAALAEAQKEKEGDEFWRADIDSMEAEIKNEMTLNNIEVKLSSNLAEEEFKQLKREFPKLAYSREELEMLKSNGSLTALIHPAIHCLPDKIFCSFNSFRQSAENYRITSDETINNSFPIYANHFYKKKFVKCWVASLKLKERRELIVLVLIFSFLSLHFIREDSGSFLDSELDRRRMLMPRKFRWLVVGKYWKFFIWPVSKKKLPRLIEKVFQDYKIFQEKQVSKEVKREAKKYWKEVENAKSYLSEDELRYAQDLFRRASDLNRTLSSQATALAELKVAEAQLEEKIKLRQNAARAVVMPKTNFSPNSSGGKTDWTDRKEILLSALEILLPKDISLKLESWETGELDNLRLALLQLKDMRQDLRRIFLKQDNFRDMIKTTAPFMIAVRTDNKKAIIRVLGVESDHLLSIVPEDAPIEKEVEPNFRKGIKITIIGFVKNPDLEAAIRELFGKETIISFLAAEKKERLLSLGQSDPKDRLVISTAIPHAYVEIFKTNGLKNIHVGQNSKYGYKKRVLEEVIRKNYTDLFV